MDELEISTRTEQIYYFIKMEAEGDDWDPENITKTFLYNFDPWGLHGVYIIFLISAQNIDFAEAVLTSTHNLCFEQKYEKISQFFIWKFWFVGGKIFSIFE